MTRDRRVLRPIGFVPTEAKLRPPKRADGLVSRTHLLDRLLGSAGVPVVVVAAPPGYGKTVLVGEWDEADERPFAWLSADEADNDPAVLLSYVLLALQRVEPVAPEVSMAITNDASWNVVLPRLGRMLRRRRPFVLVLEGVDALTSRGALQVVRVIAEQLPTGGQLVLSSRAMPRVALDEMRAAGQVLDIGTNDLRLSLAEGLELVAATGLRLGEADVDALLQTTEGWAAGMYLATLSLSAEAEGPTDVDTVAGSDTVIARYLRDELLYRLAPEDQRFLMRASILSEMSGDLCDAVLDSSGSAEVLRRLAASNVLLLQLDEDGTWFHCHRMFAEALRAELRRREPQLLRTLHSRASQWFEANDAPEEAIRHATAATDVERAARLIWHHAPELIATGRVRTLELLLDGLEPRQVTSHASLAFAAAWCALQSGRPIDYLISMAERGRYDASVKGASVSVAAAAALLNAAVARRGVAQMRADAQLAIDLQALPGAWVPAARLLEAVACALAGQTDEARSRLETVERLAVDAAAHDVAALALAWLAVMAIDVGDWAAATDLTVRATALMHEHRLDDLAPLLLVHGLHSLMAARDGRSDEAAVRLRRCRSSLALYQQPPLWLAAQCREVLARTALDLDDSAAARTLLSEVQRLMSEAPDMTAVRGSVEQLWRRITAMPLVPGRGSSTLTSAELRVLHFLPTNLSFEQIGRQLYISRNTVKTEAIAVYRKLGVNSRSEAVERAVDLGLIE